MLFSRALRRYAAGRSLPLPALRNSAPVPLSYWSQSRYASTGSTGGANDYQFGPSNDVQPQPSTQRLTPEEEDEGGGKKDEGKGGKKRSWRGSTSFKMFESSATTAASLAVLGLAGYAYHKYYKLLVLKKIEGAFQKGDPALRLAGGSNDEPWIEHEDQRKMDAIVRGDEPGHYYLVVGEKGTGKTSMLLRAMHKQDGENCSMMEAHANPEIFRIRLGKCLDFEFHEDYIGSLFSIHGPRETTALLDIERALNKLEKAAMNKREEGGGPLIMIINGMHMLREDEEGRDLLELLQQRAEAWAASGLVTMVFNSDDYWVYERMKQYGSRMEMISIKDLPRDSTVTALGYLRKKFYPREKQDMAMLNEVYDLVGGRLAFLTRVAKEKDMIKKCRDIIEDEKCWLLSQCGLLGMEMDDDVMDQQKYASSCMLLIQKLVEMEDENPLPPGSDHKLPELPLYRARQVMTRADFIQAYDHYNLITIDSKANVRADSVAMQNAYREIIHEEGFAEYLDATMERIGDIESLGRTRELTMKDLWNGGGYRIDLKNYKGSIDKTVEFNVVRGTKGIHGDGDD